MELIIELRTNGPGDTRNSKIVSARISWLDILRMMFGRTVSCPSSILYESTKPEQLNRPWNTSECWISTQIAWRDLTCQSWGMLLKLAELWAKQSPPKPPTTSPN